MSNSTKVVIIGASGFGREVLWTIRECNKTTKAFNILGFIDDNPSIHKKLINGMPVLGDLSWLLSNYKNDVKCVIAIADCKIREKIAITLEKNNFEFPIIIHPSTHFSDYVEIGCGTIIQAGCIITVDSKIGKHVHLNLHTTVGPDSVFNDFVTLNPGVHVNGKTMIEKGVNVGTGTVMKQGIRIGKWSVIGAGTVLINNVPEFSLCVGVPGKIKRKLILED